MGIEQFIQSICVQTAVIWRNPQSDGMGGISFDAPEEIDVRWQNTDKILTLVNGDSYSAEAEIFVTADVVPGEYIYLGTLDDLDSAQEENPKSIQGAYMIRRFDKTPMIKSTSEFVRKAYI